MSTWHKVQSFKKRKPHLKKKCSHNIALRARLWRISLIRDCCGRAQPIVKSDETKTDCPRNFSGPVQKKNLVLSSKLWRILRWQMQNIWKPSFRCYRVQDPLRQHRLHFLKLVPGRRPEVEYETKSSSLLRKWGRINILLGGPSTGTRPISHSSSRVWYQVPKRICNAMHFYAWNVLFSSPYLFYMLIHTIGYNFSSIISFSGKSLVLFPFPAMECYYDPFLQDWDNHLSCMEMYVFCRKGFHVAGTFLEPQNQKSETTERGAEFSICLLPKPPSIRSGSLSSCVLMG